MTESQKPITVVPETPDSEVTVITTRLNRKKIAKALGAAAAAAGALAMFGAAMKARGRDEFIEDVRHAADEELASENES